MIKPLDRTNAEYKWALETWLTTPDLSNNERTLIHSLISSLGRSLEDFDQMRRIALQPAFINTLASAVEKARRAGLLTDWNDYAKAA